MTAHVFVYGSLKEGHWNNRVLGASKKIGEAITKAKFLLTDCGFPYMIPEQALRGSERAPTAPVLGEVWEVTSDSVMEALDALEGVGYGHYQHHTVEVYGLDGTKYEALAYVPCDVDEAAALQICKTVDLNDAEVYVWNRD